MTKPNTSMYDMPQQIDAVVELAQQAAVGNGVAFRPLLRMNRLLLDMAHGLRHLAVNLEVQIVNKCAQKDISATMIELHAMTMLIRNGLKADETVWTVLEDRIDQTHNPLVVGNEKIRKHITELLEKTNDVVTKYNESKGNNDGQQERTVH